MQDNYLQILEGEKQELAEALAKMQQIVQDQNDDKEKGSKLKSKLNRITASKKKISKSLKSKEREIKQLKNDLNAARNLARGDGTTKNLNEKLIKLQKDLEDKNKKIERISNENQKKDDIIESLNNQINDLQANNSQLQRAVVAPHEEYGNQPSDHKHSEDHKESDIHHDEDDEYKDDSYEDPQESNIIEENQVEKEEENKESEEKGKQKPIVSQSEVKLLFEKLRIICQRQKIEYNNLSQIFPDTITIMNLEHKLKSLRIKDPEERLTLSRYIIEPRSENRIRFEENREISKDNAEKILKSKIEEYKTYENEEEQLKLRFRELLGRYSSTLRDSLELEDLRECGYIPATTLKG